MIHCSPSVKLELMPSLLECAFCAGAPLKRNGIEFDTFIPMACFQQYSSQCAFRVLWDLIVRPGISRTLSQLITV